MAAECSETSEVPLSLRGYGQLAAAKVGACEAMQDLPDLPDLPCSLLASSPGGSEETGLGPIDSLRSEDGLTCVASKECRHLVSMRTRSRCSRKD